MIVFVLQGVSINISCLVSLDQQTLFRGAEVTNLSTALCIGGHFAVYILYGQRMDRLCAIYHYHKVA